MLILDVLDRAVRERGDDPFIRHEGEAVGYADFDRRSNRLARVLRELGLQKGDRVTVAMGNSVEYLVALFGVLKAGGVYHPVNPALGPGELAYVIRHCEPRVILTAPGSAERILDPGVPRPADCRVAAFGDVTGAESLEPLLARADDGALEERPGPDDSSILLYTSGTTGHPKGVRFTHRKTGASGRHFVETLGIEPSDTVLAVTPLFHGNAWGAVVTALYAGGTVAFPAQFRAGAFWPLVHEVQATVLYTLGTILAILLSREPTDLERKNPLRVILGLGSAPIRDRIIERFGVEHVAECFGSTDAGVVTITPLGCAPRPGSAGPAVPGVEIRILDDAGRPLSVGQPGEIAIRSPMRMDSYFRDPGETAAALRDDWFLTGDLGYLDEEGWLYFVDRKRDVIRRGGENVSSVLIEKTLREHPAVDEAAVIGIPDPVLGQEIKAYVVASRAVSADELQSFAAERLAKFQVPRLWELRDSLPKTATQRIEKYKLRRESSPDTKPLLG